MKLLTQKETDSIFNKLASGIIPGNYKRVIDSAVFNKLVNELLMDPKLVKRLLKRVQRIKSKL